MHFYHIYGLVIAADQIIAGLEPIELAGQPPDATVHFRPPPVDISWQPPLPPSPHWVNKEGDIFLEIKYSKDKDYISIWYRSGLEFILHRQTNALYMIATPEKMVDGEYASYLLGAGFGLILRSQGVFALHGSGVEVDGKALIFIGPSGVGKSTTATNFIMRGHAIITDDVAPIRKHDNGWRVATGYPNTRLWEDSAQKFQQDTATMRPVMAKYKKYFVDIENFDHKDLPLGGIFHLIGRDPLEQPDIKRLDTQEAIIDLTRNSYGRYFLNRALLRQQFSTVAQLAQDVPMHDIMLPHDMDRFDVIYEHLLRLFRATS